MKLWLLSAVGIFLSLQPARAEPKRLYVERSEASSFLMNNWNKYQENYHPNYAFDDNPETAWVEGVDGDGVGERLNWEVSSLKTAREVVLQIWNGYQKTGKLFEANSMPKDVEITVFSSGRRVVARQKFELKKVQGSQKLTIDLPKESGLDEIQLKVLSTFPGKTYKDTCISDIQVFVDSKVPYNQAVEFAKRDTLKEWVKHRLDDAKYFATLPKDYPFSSSVFQTGKLVDESENEDCSPDGLPTGKRIPTLKQMIFESKKTERSSLVFGSTEVELVRNLFARAKALREDPKWFKKAVVAKKNRIRMPDSSAITQESVLDHFDGGSQSFFETRDAVSKLREERFYGEPSYFLQSSYKLQRDPGKKISAIYFWSRSVAVERGLNVIQRHFLLTYGPDQFPEHVLIWENERDHVVADRPLKELAREADPEDRVYRPYTLTLYVFSRNESGKIGSFQELSGTSVDDYGCNYNSYSKYTKSAVSTLASATQ